ncbi:hypothetical protein [Methanobacterium sp.]|uniref:hypothetical protein n=1 Tax=Methanobacterium sp. TaxID=2164 RepID=UPI003C7822A4
MLDWSKIDNDKLFQRLVNHLFALECNSPGFIPSSPYIGADGGWDGKYIGYYPFEKIGGVWSIQAKWTTKSFKDAKSQLREDIKKELKKAKRNNVHHLRMVTNAEFKVDQIEDLEKLNNDQVLTLKIWHREELTRRIELQPFLRSYFFNLPQHPKFVPPNFDKCENVEIPNLNSNFNDYLGKSEEFVRNDKKNVLIVHSSGDYGKTYLLDSIPENVHKINFQLQSWIVRPGFRDMKDSLQDEIINGRKYLLIFDDADRYLEEIPPLLSFCKHYKDSIKVILACREAGLKYIYDMIKNEQIEDIYDDIQIQRWTKNDLIQVLNVITNENKLEFEEIAVRYPSPSLMVVIGNIIKNKPEFNFEKFEERYINKLLYDAKRCLEDFIDPKKIEYFLLNLASIIPFSEKDNVLLEAIENEFNLNEDDIKEIIMNLKDNGLLRNVGGAIRFDPDLKGDLFLAYVLKNLSDDKLKNLINIWLPLCADKLFINLEEAFAHEQSDALKNILSEVVNSWIMNVEETDGYSRIQNLNLLKEMCIIVPEDCLNLLNVYLDYEAPSSKNPKIKRLKMENTFPTTSNYEPILLKLKNFDGLRGDLLILIKKIASKNFSRSYSYACDQLIKKFVDPTENNTNSIIETLNVFDEWLDNPNEIRVKLISSALSEVLQGAHDQVILIQGRIYPREVPQPRTKNIIKIRKKALEVLKKMTICSSSKYLKESIEVAKKIGQTINKGKLPISDIILLEKKEFIDTIGQLITDITDFRILIGIEDLLLNLWAREEVYSNKIQIYLSKIPENIEYISFKYFNGNFVIEDFNSFFKSFKKESPVEGRWDWFCERKSEHTMNMYDPYHYKNFIDKLNKIYKTKDQILDFLQDLDKYLSDSNSYPPISTCWVKKQPDLFLEIRNDMEIWNKVPRRFKGEIDIALSEINEDHIKIMAKEVLSNLTNEPYFEIETFLRSINKTSLDREIVDSWLLELLEKSNSNIRLLIIRRLNSIFGNDFNSMINYLTLIISKEEELNNEMVEQIDYKIRFFNTKLDFIDQDLLDNFKNELFEKMKDVPDITQKQSILNFILLDIDSIIEFIDYRLSKYEIAQSEVRINYNPIPFDGIESIRECIKSFEDFEKFMDKIIEWYDRTKLRRHFLRDIKSNISISEKESGKLFLEKYIENNVKNGKIENAIRALTFLPFSEERISFIIDISENIMKSNVLNVDQIEKIFYRNSGLEGSYSTVTGEVPRELLEKKALFEKMHEEAKPGRLKMIINNCIKITDQGIERHTKLDEETLNPRR